MGRKCNVQDCLSDSRRIEDQGVTFHKMPLHLDLRPKWMSLCRIPPERQSNKVIYVCSRHFLKADFCNFKGTKYLLKQGALPSVFPWTLNNSNEPLEESQNKTEIEEDFTKANANEESKVNEDISQEQVKDYEEPEDVKLVDCNSDSESSPVSHTKDSIADASAAHSTSSDDTPAEFNSSSQVEQTTSAAKQSGGVTKQTASENTIVFSPGTRIEANDFNDRWYPAKIVEVDHEDREVLIHFEKYSNRYDEWIPMDSSRLRPLQLARKSLSQQQKSFKVGEKCMAVWSDSRKFPATVTKVLEGDTFEVLFDDGFVKVLKITKLSKLGPNSPQTFASPPTQASPAKPLFDDSCIGTKEERRERKRKINVAELFSKKRQRRDGSQDESEERASSNQEEATTAAANDPDSEWTCRWLDGAPVGEESEMETLDGPKRAVKLPDHRLPPGWEKYFTQKIPCSATGKWDAVITSPDGKKFRTRTEIKQYLEEHKLDHSLDSFDFALHLNRAKKLGLYETSTPDQLPPTTTSRPSQSTKSLVKGLIKTKMGKKLVKEKEMKQLKIIQDGDAFRCPIEGCGKQFRKENLAQMHVKHYHPEYTKYIGTTVNVADLAYARTVGDLIEEPPKPPKVQPPTDKLPRVEPVLKQKGLKVISPNIPEDPSSNLMSTSASATTAVQTVASVPVSLPSPVVTASSNKSSANAEIIKLLNTEFSPQPPDIPLDHLASGTETTATPKGILEPKVGKIKTLMPVRSSAEIKEEITPVARDETSRRSLRKKSTEMDLTRKRRAPTRYEDEFLSHPSHHHDDDKHRIRDAMHGPATSTPQQSDYPKVIIEGGEVIKIVHMKREEIINCTCGVTEEDGLMIQCELCCCWQHAYCNNIQKESQVPEKYVCYICQNPKRARPSRKYFHDQEWLKEGRLAVANVHPRDERTLQQRFEVLRRSHDLTGNLLELKDYIHSLAIKIAIAEKKDHPKLYLWAKPWDKPQQALFMKKEDVFMDPVKTETVKEEIVIDDAAKDIQQTSVIDKLKDVQELMSVLEGKDCDPTDKLLGGVVDPEDKDQLQKMADFADIIGSGLVDSDKTSQSDPTNLLSPLTESEIDRISKTIEEHMDTSSLVDVKHLPTLQLPPPIPNIPQPEAAINPVDCRLNLIDHIDHYQRQVNERLDFIEAQISELERFDPPVPDETHEMYPRTKSTIQMLLKDLHMVKELTEANSPSTTSLPQN